MSSQNFKPVFLKIAFFRSARVITFFYLTDWSEILTAYSTHL